MLPVSYQLEEKPLFKDREVNKMSDINSLHFIYSEYKNEADFNKTFQIHHNLKIIIYLAQNLGRSEEMECAENPLHIRLFKRMKQCIKALRPSVAFDSIFIFSTFSVQSSSFRSCLQCLFCHLCGHKIQTEGRQNI